MTRRPVRGRKTLRDKMHENQRGLDDWALTFGKEQMLNIPVKPKRQIVNRSDGDELESAVLREVGELLAWHPKVLFAVRQNSGAAYLPGKNGADMPVFFYKIIRTRYGPMRLPDFWGLLTNGRMFAVECKRRSWSRPTDQREREQQAFLEMVKHAGGVALFTTSAGAVLAALPTD